MKGLTLQKVNIILLSILALMMLWVLWTAKGYEREIRTFVPITPRRLREFMDKPIQELSGC